MVNDPYSLNLHLLNLLAIQLGGSVSSAKKQVRLSFTSKKDIHFISLLIDKYPLLTTRMRSAFCPVPSPAKLLIDPKSGPSSRCLNKFLTPKRSLPIYFPYFLSGFIEAVGTFHALKAERPKSNKGPLLPLACMVPQRLIGELRIHIPQGESQLIWAIGFSPINFSLFEIGPLDPVLEHFTRYPLLGEKSRS